MEITTIKIENPQGLNFVLGQSHFIKTVEDIYEIMVTTVPMAKFALAFCEASDTGSRQLRCSIMHLGRCEYPGNYKLSERFAGGFLDDLT